MRSTRTSYQSSDVNQTQMYVRIGPRSWLNNQKGYPHLRPDGKRDPVVRQGDTNTDTTSPRLDLGSVHGMARNMSAIYASLSCIYEKLPTRAVRGISSLQGRIKIRGSSCCELTPRLDSPTLDADIPISPSTSSAGLQDDLTNFNIPSCIPP